jgi:hypothetical protein
LSTLVRRIDIRSTPGLNAIKFSCQDGGFGDDETAVILGVGADH